MNSLKQNRCATNRVVHSRESFAIHTHYAGPNELHLTGCVEDKPLNPDSTCAALYRQIAAILSQGNFQIVLERIFGSIADKQQILAARQTAFLDTAIGKEQPITFIQGHPWWGTGLAGVQIQAVRPSQPGEETWTLRADEIPCGRAWKLDGATHIVLQNLHGLPSGSDTIPDRSVQADCMFERANKILQANGATCHDVVRTWIYLSDILQWYGEFNEARNAKYNQWGLMPKPDDQPSTTAIRLPASTGIQGDNPLGAACIMDLLAVAGPKNAVPEIVQMTNIKQKDAFRYGGAFSRGACIRRKDCTQIHVSGTAAIDEQGQSLHAADPEAQIQRTLDNIDALVAQTRATLKNVSSATAFLKRSQDIDIYRRILARRGLDNLPAVCLIADICRPELLFEMDAIVALPAAR